MAHLEITRAQPTKDGLLRLEFAIHWGNSRLTMGGFRYNPETNKLLSPTFTGRNGGKVPLVKVEGELSEAMNGMVRNYYSEVSHFNP